MAGYGDPGFDTLALHAGASPDPVSGARAVPIHLTTSFVFESSDQAAALFNLERPGHVYSRISNPTNAVLEQRVAALEGGIGAITTASGQAALHLTIATLHGGGLAHRGLDRFVWWLAQLAALHLEPIWHQHHLCQTRRFAGLERRHPAQHQTLFLAKPWVTPGWMCWTSKPSAPSPTKPACHCWWTPPSPRPGSSSPLTMVPIWFTTRPPNFLSGHGTVVGGVVVDGGSF